MEDGAGEEFSGIFVETKHRTNITRNQNCQILFFFFSRAIDCKLSQNRSSSNPNNRTELSLFDVAEQRQRTKCYKTDYVSGLISN